MAKSFEGCVVKAKLIYGKEGACTCGVYRWCRDNLVHDVLLNLQHILLGQGGIVGHGLQLLELRHLLGAQHDDVLLAIRSGH